MDHADVRTMFSEATLSDEAQRHLTACPDCRAWSESLADVRRVAVEVLAPPAPPGLAERSIAAARQWAGAERKAAAVRYVVPRVPWWRRVAWRAATAAALAGAVAAGAMQIPGRDEGGSPQRLALVAAARKTAEAKTARVRFSGDMRATFRVELPEIPAPSIPPDLLANLDRLPQEMRREFEREMERFRAEARRAADSLPRTMTFAMHMTGTGSVVFPDAMHLRGTMTPEGNVPLPIGGPFELIVVGDRAWIKMAITGGAWVRIPAAESPFRLTFEPGSFLALMGAEGAVEDLGEETLDGERVRHFRMRDEMREPTDHAAGVSVVDFWVGAEDRILRKAVANAEGRTAAGPASGSFSSSGTMQLFDFGADVAVSPPPADEVKDGAPLFTSGAFRMGVGDAGFSVSISARAAAAPPAAPRPAEPPPVPRPDQQPTPYSESDPYEGGGSPSPPPEYAPPPEWSPYPEPSPAPEQSPAPYPEPSPWASPKPYASPSASWSPAPRFSPPPK